ncbi:transposase domain-containing protein [Bradyrhizobium sp. NC92]|uniref:transposase domain-containing protein n=1 Tax=Bradyrhizobium sp. (strain NC92) TaxID=55395 RepID=UPI0021AA4432|nr:transposase domain-containing protein [Bradyrhizobium sp. NC92]UWU67752.1 transposase domain-containing protein [Bradyrhizobium sp. NC92]
MLASIVPACKLNDVNPVTYIAETLEAIIAGHSPRKIDDLMPWRFRKRSSRHQ